MATAEGESSLSEPHMDEQTTSPSNLQYVQLIPIFSSDDKLFMVAFLKSLDHIQNIANWNPPIHY